MTVEIPAVCLLNLPACIIVASPFVVKVAFFTGVPTLLALMVRLTHGKDDPLGRIPLWLRIAAPHVLALWLAAFLWLGGHTDPAIDVVNGVLRSLVMVAFIATPVWFAVWTYRRYMTIPKV